MGRSKRPKQLHNNAGLSFADTILGGLAEELTDLGLTVSFVPTIHENDKESHGSVRVYTTGKAGIIARVNITCCDGKFIVQDSCGEHKMAGKLEFELADPTNSILQYVNRRIWHWAQIERIFA